MDFSLFPTVLSKKEPNIAQEKSESAEMWKIQLIWGFWWHYKSGGGLYKFGGGSRMAVTSNCVNEKKFFQLESGEETRNIPILINFYQCIAKWWLWKQSKKIFTVFWVLCTQPTTKVEVGDPDYVEPEKEHCWQIWNSIFWQIRPSCGVRNTLCLVQFGGRPYKSDRCGHNSEWKNFLTSSPGTLAYGVIDLGVFLPLVIHLPNEKSILPKFSSLRGVAILGWESLSPAGSARAGSTLSHPIG